MVINHDFFMRQALDEAWRYQGVTYPNPAVGCCIVGEKNELLAINAHKKAGFAHAEVEALRDAYTVLTGDKTIASLLDSAQIHAYLLQNHNNIFSQVSLYTTLEPCSHVGKTPSCASLIATLGIKKVYVGAKDSNPEASCGNAILRAKGVEVHENILASECEELLYPFKLWHAKRFVFFKWAQRLNGTFEGGIISSQESREEVHAMRDCCDLLVIGGNTVRLDRPTLDARLVGGKAPDVLIVSNSAEFDKTIPLFHVGGRKVFIENNLSKIASYKNIMIEGGSSMFVLTKEIVDRYVCYLAPTFGGTQGFLASEEKFEILNHRKDAKDIIMWMKRK